MTNRTAKAKELSRESKGQYKWSNLTKTSGMTEKYLSNPLITYLKDGEIPHYFWKNIDKGFAKITNDNKKFIHHRPSGDHYLLVTNYRLLFVGGGNGDKTMSFEYKNINNLELKTAFLRSNAKIWFTHDDTDYIMHAHKYNDYEDAIDYIESRISDAPIEIESKQKGNDTEQKQSKVESGYKQSRSASSPSHSTNEPSSGTYPDTPQKLVQTIGSSGTKEIPKDKLLEIVRDMNPYKFEELVAEVWENQGWNAEVTDGSADRGVDIVAVKDDRLEQRRHLIQAKRHGENTKVGSEDIQRYASLYQRDEQVDNVFIVTSNEFTSEAEVVAERRDVSLVDYDELYEMINGE